MLTLARCIRTLSTICERTTRLLSSTSILFPRTTLHQVSKQRDSGHGVANEGSSISYKWESGGISWRGLDEELVSPAVKSLEALGVVHIVD
jgi:hypothetical protein